MAYVSPRPSAYRSLLSVSLAAITNIADKRGQKWMGRRLISAMLIILIVMFLTSCDDLLNVLVMQKDGNNYFVGKVAYYDWTGRGGTIALFDKKSNTEVCRGKYSMTQNSLACYGKEFHAKLACSNGRTADFNFATTLSCTESYGSAVDDLGNVYEVYIGISDEMMNSKLAEYKTKWL